MRIFQFSKQQGQTLIETVVALAAAVVILGAISIVVTSSINNVTFLSNQDLASKYAAQGMAYIQSLRNSNYNSFSGYSGFYCLPDNNGTSSIGALAGTNTSTSCTANVGGNVFKRVVGFTSNSANCNNNEVEVTITVYFTSGKCGPSNTYCHNTTLSSCMGNGPVVLPTP